MEPSTSCSCPRLCEVGPTRTLWVGCPQGGLQGFEEKSRPTERFHLSPPLPREHPDSPDKPVRWALGLFLSKLGGCLDSLVFVMGFCHHAPSHQHGLILSNSSARGLCVDNLSRADPPCLLALVVRAWCCALRGVPCRIGSPTMRKTPRGWRNSASCHLGIYTRIYTAHEGTDRPMLAPAPARTSTHAHACACMCVPAQGPTTRPSPAAVPCPSLGLLLPRSSEAVPLRTRRRTVAWRGSLAAVGADASCGARPQTNFQDMHQCSSKSERCGPHSGLIPGCPQPWTRCPALATYQRPSPAAAANEALRQKGAVRIIKLTIVTDFGLPLTF